MDNNIGNIVAHYEQAGLRIAAAKLVQLSKEKAEGFYIEHKERPFFGSLVGYDFCTCTLVVLEGENAVKKKIEVWVQQTLLKLLKGQSESFMQNQSANAVHGKLFSFSRQEKLTTFPEKNEIVSRF